VPSHRTKPQAASAQSVITTMLARADMRPLVSIGICRFPKCSKNCMARLSLPMRQLKEILHHPCERATLFCHNLHQIADNAQDRSWVNVHGHSRILSYPHCSLIGQGHPFRSDRHRPAARGLEDPALIPSKVVVSGTWFDQMLQLKVGSWPNSVGRHYPRATDGRHRRRQQSPCYHTAANEHNGYCYKERRSAARFGSRGADRSVSPALRRISM
jgi:hypothetical protein